MTTHKFLLQYIVPAIILTGFAFWCGAQKNILFAMAGFLGSFLIAVSLVIEGWKKFRNQKKPEKNL